MVGTKIDFENNKILLKLFLNKEAKSKHQIVFDFDQVKIESAGYKIR